MEKSPKVSVLTANYNKTKYLRDYFKSILRSNYDNLEVIFVDDGSNDDSIQIANEFVGQLNLHIISLKQNVGFANALNAGLERCKGKYIMRLDPDDFITKERIDCQCRFLEQNPNIDVIGSNTYYYNQNLQRAVFTSNFPTHHSEIKKNFSNGLIAVSHPGVIVKADFYKQFKYDQSVFPFEEYDIFSRMIVEGGVFHNLSEPLTYYRHYKQNCSYKHIRNRLIGISKLRQKYFHKSTHMFWIWVRTFHEYFYRNGLSARSITGMRFLLLLSSLFAPKTIVKRLFSPYNNKRV